jgi:hypothetical protein
MTNVIRYPAQIQFPTQKEKRRRVTLTWISKSEAEKLGISGESELVFTMRPPAKPKAKPGG